VVGYPRDIFCIKSTSPDQCSLLFKN
jgi:hypothetical protein